MNASDAPAPPKKQKSLARKIVVGLAYFVLAFIAFALIAIYYAGLRAREGRIIINASSAAYHIRQLGYCALAYAEANPALGFPAEAALLGPEGSGCIDQVLLNAATPGGEAKIGYRFQFVPGVPGAGGMIVTITIRARPTNYYSPYSKSFYVDETGVIRYTGEDRPATKDDPVDELAVSSERILRVPPG